MTNQESDRTLISVGPGPTALAVSAQGDASVPLYLSLPGPLMGPLYSALSPSAAAVAASHPQVHRPVGN